jgi:hypothetical protein
LAAFSGQNDSAMLPAVSRERGSTERQRFVSSQLRLFMSQLVVDIYLSDLVGLYWQKQQQLAPCHILKMRVNESSTVLFVEYLVIKELRRSSRS